MATKKDLRLTILGSAYVGKTALTLKFANEVFLQKYDPTIENVYFKKMNYGESNITYEIIDTAGSVIPFYYVITLMSHT